MRDKRAEKGIKIIVVFGILSIIGLCLLGRTLNHYGIGEPTAAEKARLTTEREANGQR